MDVMKRKDGTVVIEMNGLEAIALVEAMGESMGVDRAEIDAAIAEVEG